MHAIEFENVDFAYSEEGKAEFCIKGLNFAVEEGEFVAVLGHNGSGKSTLARLSNGILVPDGGKITAFGTPLDEKHLFDVRKQVGVVFQNPDNQTVASIVEDDVAFGAENVGMPREEIASTSPSRPWEWRRAGMPPSRGSRAGRNSASPSRACSP